MMHFVLSTLRRWNSDYQPPSGRTGELFVESLRQIQARTHKLFYCLLLIQYPAAVAVALIWSPLAWSGSTSTIHFHVWLAIAFGGLLTSLPIYLIRICPAASITRQAVAIAQMLMGALLIHLSGGRIETHFHVFGSLAFLAFYRDMRVLATATVIVSVDHLVRGLFFPESVYGMISASNWRFVEHALWVVFEDIFLAMACVQGRAQISAMASQQAQIEKVNDAIEAAVRVRTHELSLKTEELAVARDAAMESTRLKSQFLASVSHELRTPMNGVLGMTSALLNTDLTRDQRDCALTVQRSAEGLLTIIKDILDISKIEAGKMSIEHQEFNVCSEIDDVAALLADAARRKNLTFVREIDPTVPSVLSADAGRLRQILVNLIGNAIKFTESGKVSVRVRTAERTGRTCRVRFEVFDTGIGISEDARKNLFEAFVQVDGSTTRKHEGTGLGLAISKQLVELMGGQIGFDSTPGAGSTFWFEIPVEVGRCTARANRKDNQAAHQAVVSPARKLSVLVAEDNLVNQRVLTRMLERLGHRYHVVADGEAAIDAVRRSAYDIVLMDCQMPHVDGFKATTEIRGLAGINGQVPIVAVTANAMNGDRERCLAVGMTGYIAKPVRFEELAQALVAHTALTPVA